MWPGLIQETKQGGVDMIETYIFWNLHEPVPYQYDFAGQKDLVHFIKLVAEAGLYAFLRFGPYICSEWNFGCFPVWLHFLPHIEFRTNNETFKIENECGDIQGGYGAGAKPYIEWAPNMANSLRTGVLWVMCQQPDAPYPMIGTCNGYYCDQCTYYPRNKRKIWKECWSGWNTYWVNAVPYRPTEDHLVWLAFFNEEGPCQTIICIMVGLTLDGLVVDPSFPQVMTMVLLLMNMNS